MDVFDLFAKLSLDTSGYEQGMSDARGTAESGGSKIGQALGMAGKIGATAIAAVTTASVAMGTAMVKGAAETAAYGDHIDKMSQKLGMSAEAYQEWDAIMQHSGTSIESMQASMKTLANAVENGNKAFERLGMTQEQIAGMSQEELFSATVTALQNVENETERTYLAGQLLGRGATELGALLNTSAEETEAMRRRVHELGGVMSDEAVKAAARYQDSLQDMQTAFKGLFRGLTSEFLPGITTVMDGLTELFAGNGSGMIMISEGVDNLVAAITDQLPRFVDTGIGILDSILSAIIENLPKLAEAAIQIILSISQNIIMQLPKLLDAAVEIIFAIADGLIYALPGLIPAIVEMITVIATKLTEPSMLMHLIQAAVQIISALAAGLVDAIPVIIEALPTIILNIVQALIMLAPQLIASGVQLMAQLAIGIVDGVASVVEGIVRVFAGAKDAFMERIGNAREWGADMIDNFISGIVGKAQDLWGTLTDIAQGVRNFLGFSEPKLGPLSNFHTYAPDMMELFAKGIRDNKSMLQDTVADAFDFGTTTMESAVGMRGGGNVGGGFPDTPIIIQVTLDGEVIGETSWRYARRKERTQYA